MPTDIASPFDLTPDTLQRFDEELLTIRQILQAALRDAGDLDKERADWTFDDLVPIKATAQRPITSRRYDGRPAALIGATVIVHQTHASLFGVREQLARSLRRIREEFALIERIAKGRELQTHLQNVAVIERACHVAGERAADIHAPLMETLNQLQPSAMQQFANYGVELLDSRREPVVVEGFYRGRGRGPVGHFIFVAWDFGFTPSEIAAYFLWRELRNAELSELQKRDMIADEAERISQRLKSYRKLLQPHWRGISGEVIHPVEVFQYQAFMVHVEPMSALAIHSGSRDGLPGFYWDSSPLDSNGAPTKLPPWETPGSSEGSS